ncbi:MAG: phenylalanine--tRNA ligase subunit alpha [Bacteroidales bacterium]
MKERIEVLLAEIKNFSADSIEKIEEFRIKTLGKKGRITLLFEDFKKINGEEKRELGKQINELKVKVQNCINNLKEQLEGAESKERPSLDTTRCTTNDYIGTRHPVATVRGELLSIFKRLGFAVQEGPEIEDDWHVFGALNFAPEHPARDMQDTFFIEKKEGEDNPILLRTHTSSIQVRAMQTQTPPIRIVCPGRVYRNEAVSARAHCMFHQVEGLYVDEKVSFADLKQTLLYFAKEMFGSKVNIRLRPSFFPFTEPSAEMDVSCSICSGKGCNICKGTGWLEVGGCGMVDPNVLESCKIDSKKFSGFAFGMGVERIVMLKYQVRDLRLYFENDLRFLQQFKATI